MATVESSELNGTSRLCIFSKDLELLSSIDLGRSGSDFVVAQGLRFDPTNRLLVSGFARSATNPDQYEMYVRKYASDTALMWDVAYRGPDDVFGYGLESRQAAIGS